MATMPATIPPQPRHSGSPVKPKPRALYRDDLLRTPSDRQDRHATKSLRVDVLIGWAFFERERAGSSRRARTRLHPQRVAGLAEPAVQLEAE